MFRPSQSFHLVQNCIQWRHVQLSWILTAVSHNRFLSRELFQLFTYLPNYSMVQSPSWEANWFVASQEILRISRNQKVHYRTHKRPPRMWVFLNMNVLQGGVVSTSSYPQAGGPPLVGSPRLLIQFIRSYRPYRWPFLYPQPEDAQCRGDKDPLLPIN